MPKPFVFIHVPRTAGTYLSKLFLSLDVSQVRKNLGLNPFRRVSMLEKVLLRFTKKNWWWPQYGSFIFKEYHTKYYQLNVSLRHYPCVVVIREPSGWYTSYLEYFMHQSPFIAYKKNWYDNVAGRAKDDPIVQVFVDKYLPKLDFSHWRELFLTNPAAFLFFMKNIRIPALIKQTVPSFSIDKPIELDYMTCFYIWALSSDPAKILNQPRDTIREYFESQRYIKDMGKCFFVHQENLLNEIHELLINEMDYSQGLVDYTIRSIPPVNWTPPKKKNEMRDRAINDASIQDEINNSFIHYYQALAPKLND